MLMRSVLIAVVLSAGCSKSKFAPVSGRVTLDGQPLGGAHVNFQPIADEDKRDPGSGSYAITDADGRYSLKVVIGDAPGAVVGKHRVEITLRDRPAPSKDDKETAKPAAKQVVPERYNRKSDLTFEVQPGGSTNANFDLEPR